MYMGSLPATSNREDWRLAMQPVDADTGAAIDIQACTITMTVRRMKDASQVLTGSTGSGEIVIQSDNSFAWFFAAQRMGALCQGEYEVGLRISQDGYYSQLFINTLAVFEGIDQQ
jgi:hypothetical protein